MFGARRFRSAGFVAAGISVVLLGAAVCWAGKHFIMPKAQPAAAYPAHDQHSKEGVTVALDPYDVSEKARVFSVHYNEIGMLPLMMVVTNNGDEPISLTSMKATLVTANRTKLFPAVPDDLYRRLSHPSARTSNYPLPFPTKKVKGGVGKEAREEILNAQFGAKAVEPHSTQAGFLFFDIQGISSPLAGAHFYLTGVRNAQGNELMYFDVPLDEYLNAPPKP
jgi:hypothetical protein